jgi:hypothetical protein
MSGNAVRRPRWRRFVSFAAFLAVVALLVPVFPRTPSKSIRARFDQILNGMTEDQVEELLGGPRGVYDEARKPYDTIIASSTDSGHLSWWYFPDCILEVSFDKGFRVDGKRIELPPRQSLVQMAMRWCKGIFTPSP